MLWENGEQCGMMKAPAARCCCWCTEEAACICLTSAAGNQELGKNRFFLSQRQWKVLKYKVFMRSDVPFLKPESRFPWNTLGYRCFVWHTCDKCTLFDLTCFLNITLTAILLMHCTAVLSQYMLFENDFWNVTICFPSLSEGAWLARSACTINTINSSSACSMVAGDGKWFWNSRSDLVLRGICLLAILCILWIPRSLTCKDNLLSILILYKSQQTSNFKYRNEILLVCTVATALPEMCSETSVVWIIMVHVQTA